MRKKQRELLMKMEQVIEEKKTLPEEEKKTISKKIMTNILILISILIYLAFLQIGEENLETDIYINILKTFSIVFIIGTIVMFEVSYKTNKNAIILHSLEVLILTFYTLFLIPAYSLYYKKFYILIISAVLVSITYYMLKSIIIKKSLKKNYFKKINDIKTIVAK